MIFMSGLCNIRSFNTNRRKSLREEEMETEGEGFFKEVNMFPFEEEMSEIDSMTVAIW